MTGTLTQSFGSELTSTATVISATTDPNPVNNSSTATRSVTDSADLVLTMAGPAEITAGTTATWTPFCRALPPARCR